jgi:hypothetical protein
MAASKAREAARLLLYAWNIAESGIGDVMDGTLHSSR